MPSSPDDIVTVVDSCLLAAISQLALDRPNSELVQSLRMFRPKIRRRLEAMRNAVTGGTVVTSLVNVKPASKALRRPNRTKPRK